MESLEKMFDAIDARGAIGDWSGLAVDFRAHMNCEFVGCYAVKLPAEVPRQVEILMQHPPNCMDEYFAKNIDQYQVVDENELPGFVPFRMSQYLSESEIRTMPHYNKGGKRHGFFYVVFSTLLLSSFELLVLGLARPEEGVDFDDQDLLRIGLTTRYLRRFL